MRWRATLCRDARGATAIEFAILAPVLCLFLTCAFDVAHTLYMRTTVQGIVQKTARDGTLESSTDTTSQTALDNKVRAQIYPLANNATLVFGRRFYRTFSQAAAAQAEPWTDTDHDGKCDHGEPYQDNNGNTVWDSDGGDAGQGGAKDRTVYTVTVTYPHMFPIYKFLGGSSTATVVATTVLENQPYSDQNSYGAPVVRNCP